MRVKANREKKCSEKAHLPDAKRATRRKGTRISRSRPDDCFRARGTPSPPARFSVKSLFSVGGLAQGRRLRRRFAMYAKEQLFAPPAVCSSNGRAVSGTGGGRSRSGPRNLAASRERHSCGGALRKNRWGEKRRIPQKPGAGRLARRRGRSPQGPSRRGKPPGTALRARRGVGLGMDGKRGTAERSRGGTIRGGRAHGSGSRRARRRVGGRRCGSPCPCLEKEAGNAGAPAGELLTGAQSRSNAALKLRGPAPRAGLPPRPSCAQASRGTPSGVGKRRRPRRRQGAPKPGGSACYASSRSRRPATTRKTSRARAAMSWLARPRPSW